jgi:hypothetical protein
MEGTCLTRELERERETERGRKEGREGGRVGKINLFKDIESLLSVTYPDCTELVY